MIKLDDEWLAGVGLASLPSHRKNEFLRHTYDTLEMRVGLTLAKQMSDELLDEFESFINAKDEAGALRFLETNFPDYKQVVDQAFAELGDEIREVAPQILAAG